MPNVSIILLLIRQKSCAQGTALDKDSILFDACLRIDAGDYPGALASSAVVKVAQLPLNYTYSEDNIINMVNVPAATPYKLAFYRQRLVADGCDCYRLVGEAFSGISTVVTRDITIDLEDSYIENLKKYLSLDENPIHHFYMCDKPAPFDSVGERKLSENLEQEKGWSVSLKERIYDV